MEQSLCHHGVSHSNPLPVSNYALQQPIRTKRKSSQYLKTASESFLNKKKEEKKRKSSQRKVTNARSLQLTNLTSSFSFFFCCCFFVWFFFFVVFSLFFLHRYRKRVARQTWRWVMRFDRCSEIVFKCSHRSEPLTERRCESHFTVNKPERRRNCKHVTTGCRPLTCFYKMNHRVGSEVCDSLC